jgi:hypothetical protein
LPDALSAAYNQGAALALDGTAYMGRDGQVYRIAGGQASVCMGATDISPGSAYDLALEEPYGLAFGTGGELYVADRWKGHVVKVDGHQVASLYAGGFGNPLKLQLDAAGALYALPESSDGLRKIAPGGQPASPTFGVPGHIVHDFVLQPDGAVVFLEIDPFGQGATATLRKWTGAGEPTVLATVTTGDYDMAIARDPLTGAIYICSEGLLRRWTPDGGVTEVKRDPWFSTAYGTGLTCDARGRVVGPNRDSIYRYDPKADKFDVLAGPQGPLFKGAGVDDSLQWPAYPTFAPNGDLYVADKGHKQVKSIPAAQVLP